MQKAFFFLILLLIELVSNAQSPKYVQKIFKTAIDTSNYKTIIPKKDGFIRSYTFDNPEVWDTHNDSSEYIKMRIKAFLITEGNIKNDKLDGSLTYFLLDSLNPSIRYKLWEQNFSNDKLNGRWNVYSLNGDLCFFETYENGILNGIARELGIDGKTILKEFEYFGGEGKSISREYFSNGNIKAEFHFEDFKLNGIAKRYYETGVLLDSVNFTDDEFNGTWKYYYPNGQLWLEKIYKMGKSWEAVGNFTKEGEKRNPGTLKNGNGTTIYYNEDGTIREIVTYRDGIAVD